MNMMPITAGILEPLGESIPLGVYASWSVYYLFGVNPYLWFAGHWTVWIVIDYIQLRGIQVGAQHRALTQSPSSTRHRIEEFAKRQ